jgi:hypothetical protein
MKLVVRLVILIAALLLVTNVSFAAPPCDEHVCYDVLFTAENGSSHTEGWDVCLNHDGTGTLSGLTPLALFGDGSITDIGFDAHPKWTKWIMHSTAISGEISTDIYGLSLWGEGYISAANSRFKVQGTKRLPCN